MLMMKMMIVIILRMAAWSLMSVRSGSIGSGGRGDGMSRIRRGCVQKDVARVGQAGRIVHLRHHHDVDGGETMGDGGR